MLILVPPRAKREFLDAENGLEMLPRSMPFLGEFAWLDSVGKLFI